MSASCTSRVRFDVTSTIGGCAALTVPSSGTVIWKSASTSSRNASKASSVRSISSISSTGGPAGSGSSACSSGRLIRKRSENTSCSMRSRSPSPSRFGQPDGDHLRAVVPLIDGGRKYRAPRSIAGGSAGGRAPGCSTLAISVLPTPASPSRNSGRPILQREIEHRRQRAVGDVVGLGQQIERGVDEVGQRCNGHS